VNPRQPDVKAKDCQLHEYAEKHKQGGPHSERGSNERRQVRYHEAPSLRVCHNRPQKEEGSCDKAPQEAHRSDPVSGDVPEVIHYEVKGDKKYVQKDVDLDEVCCEGYAEQARREEHEQRVIESVQRVTLPVVYGMDTVVQVLYGEYHERIAYEVRDQGNRQAETVCRESELQREQRVGPSIRFRSWCGTVPKVKHRRCEQDVGVGKDGARDPSNAPTEPPAKHGDEGH